MTSAYEVSTESITVERLVQLHYSGAIVANRSYQRCPAWSVSQRQAFMDATLRGFPLHGFVLHARQKWGPDFSNASFDIVDGQNRLLCLVDFIKRDTLPLPKTSGNRPALRLPRPMTLNPAPWEGCRFAQLDDSTAQRLLDRQIPVQIVAPSTPDFAVRSMFIALQGGARLTPQQIRDAMPSGVSDYVIRLAGKEAPPTLYALQRLSRQGSSTDGRGSEDKYHDNRLLCAQLLQIYLGYSAPAAAVVNFEHSDLDGMYHELVDFDPDGPDARGFEAATALLGDACEHITGKVKRKAAFMAFLLCIDVILGGDRCPLPRSSHAAIVGFHIKQLIEAYGSDEEKRFTLDGAWMRRQSGGELFRVARTGMNLERRAEGARRR